MMSKAKVFIAQIPSSGSGLDSYIQTTYRKLEE